MTDFEKKKRREARRVLGLPSFERNCRRIGHTPAYKVKDTTEYNQYQALLAAVEAYVAQYNFGKQGDLIEEGK